LRLGASFIKVTGPNTHERLAGSPIGLSLIWGVIRYMNYFNDPTDMTKSAMDGDDSNVTMTVGDIYGGDYRVSDKVTLPASMIASSFGKLKDADEEEISTVSKNDVTRGLLTLVSTNLLIFASMICKKEKIKWVCWIGAHIDFLEYN
jgi:type II pantothenate kinase